MRKTATRAGLKEAKQAYESTGLCVVGGLLSSSQVDDLDAAFREMARAHEPPALHKGRPWYLVQGDSIHFELMMDLFPELGKIIPEDRIRGIAQVLSGIAPLRLWRDEVQWKLPDSNSNGFAWHHDISRFPFDGTEFISVWVPLTDVASANSTLKWIPGSHKGDGARYWPAEVGGRPEGGFVRMPDFAALVADGALQEILVQARAGDGVFIHPWVVHGSTHNVSARDRIALLLRFNGPNVDVHVRSFTVAF